MAGFRFFAAALLLLATSGCSYSFNGGGLPSDVRSLAITEWENTTIVAGLSSDLYTVMRRQLPRDLGVRIAGEETADAVVRGRITNYSVTDPGVATVSGVGGSRGGTVTQSEVQITFDAELYDRKNDRVLWQATGQTVNGQFRRDEGRLESEAAAQALRRLVDRLVQGAQSQW